MDRTEPTRTVLETALAVSGETITSLRNQIVNDAGYPSIATVNRWVHGEEPVSEDALPMIERVFGFEVRARLFVESERLRQSRPGVRGINLGSSRFAESCAVVARELRRKGEDYAADAVERLPIT